MIDEATVWSDIWPVVEQVIRHTLLEDDDGIRPYLSPHTPPAHILDIYGFPALEILLKVVLGRSKLGLTRAVETAAGNHIHIEYVWPDPHNAASFTAADIVSITLTQDGDVWRIADINPATIDVPLTSARARGILTSNKLLTEPNTPPTEPWVLPVAFYAGLLQIPLRPAALQDEVERLLLPGLQHRTYGVMLQVKGRQLWRDFTALAHPQPDNPAAWAAAVEFILSEQDMRQQTQAAVGKSYQIGLSALVPRIKQIKKALHIQGIDERYSDVQSTHIVLKDKEET